MSLRDWLLIGGGILVLLIFLDGVRRMRQRGRLRLDIDRSLGDIPEPDLSAELPNGGARPARRRPEPDARQEPSFSSNSKAASPTSRAPVENQRSQAGQPSRQMPDDDEIDLLLADDLQGVGQGADRWLCAEGAALDAEMEPLHVDAAIDDAWLDRSWEAPEPLGDDGEEAVSRPRRVKAAPTAARSEFTEPEPVAKGPAAATRETRADDLPAEPRLTLTEKPAFAADGLDLSKPVPELVQQMASLHRAGSPPLPDTEVQMKAEAAFEPKVEVEAGPVGGSKPEPAESAGEVVPPRPPPVDTTPLTASRDGDADLEPPPASNGRDAPAGRGRKGRKKKRRVLPEIQINIFDAHPELAAEPEPQPESQPTPKAAKPAPRPPAAPEQDPVDEVLVISVAARGEPFPGNRLFKLLAACDLSLGDMAIFHRHEEPGGKGPVQFSMANAVKPGTFDPSDPDHFRTPAVTFFLHMAEPRDLANAFDCMLATAKCVAENLDGELKDENRSTLRPQTIEHCRQRIRDFKRRRMTRR